MNVAIISGRLTKDVEVQESKGKGKDPVTWANITLAVQRNADEADFINCTVWGAQAETLAKYKGKGDPLMVQGVLQQNVWKDKNDVNHYETYINVQRVEFIGGARKDEEDSEEKPAKKYTRTSRR